jgi:hypothetical protein
MAVRVAEVERVSGSIVDRNAGGRETLGPCAEIVHSQSEEVTGPGIGSAPPQAALEHQDRATGIQPERPHSIPIRESPELAEAENACVERCRRLRVRDAKGEMVDHAPQFTTRGD